MNKKLEENINELKLLGELLIDFNFPKSPPENEEIISPLKSREIIIDGYEVIVVYSKSKHPTHYVVSLQITSKYDIFLPFNIVCKLAKKFLGDKGLSLIEMFKNSKKVYCWALILDPNEEIVMESNHTEIVPCNFEGFDYNYMDFKKVNFY